jgi:hypothetical protein
MKQHLLKIIVVSVLISGSMMNLAGQVRYAGSFLELGIGARAMAMGGAFVSIADDGSAFYWNPAGASQLIRPELFGMYASLFKSLEQHHQIGYTRPIHGGVGVSLNWIRLSVSDIPAYPDPVGTYSERRDEAKDFFSWQDLQNAGLALSSLPFGFSNFKNDAFVLTLAKSYKVDLDFGWQYFVFPTEIPIGLNVKFIRQSLFDQTASGLGFDAGTLFKFGLDDLFDDNRLGKVNLALAVKDMFNTRLTWNTQSRSSGNIQRSWHMGLSYFQPIPSINGKLLFAYAWEKQYETFHHFGFEYLYRDRLAIRFGMDDADFTAGIGLQVLIFNFDYAYKGHELGGSHRISTAIRF